MNILKNTFFSALLLFAPTAILASTSTSTANGSATITTGSYSADGGTVTTTKHMDLPSFYAQLGMSTPPNPGATTSSSRGEPPATPPPPGPGGVPDVVNKVQYTIILNGWTRNTGYLRDVAPAAGGSYSDGPWEPDFDNLNPTPGGGGGGKNCDPKDLQCQSSTR